METFDFTGMDFDMALRLYMDAFRPPGEGQKIDRIMQVCAFRPCGGRSCQPSWGRGLAAARGQ